MSDQDIGEKLYNQVRDAYLEAAHFVAVTTDKEALAEFRVKFGRNPKHIGIALERHPEVFDPVADPPLFDILAALHLAAKVKDEHVDMGLWMDYLDNKSFDDLRENAKALNTKPRKPKVCRCNHPNNAECGKGGE